jgi:DNA-dependent RNA polymerase auxiliary subunit epsilon
MKKLTTLCALVFLVLFASSCKNEKSLQSYLVDTSGKEGFYTGDLPISSVLSAKADVTDEVRETIKSIKKINVAFLKKTADNEVAYEAEKATLKNIFKDNKDFVNLMTMKFKDMNVQVFYTGEDDAIDEVIAFGYGKEVGVGVARLLGENMNPAKIMEVMNSIEMDSSNLEGFSAIFQGTENK